MEVGFHTYGPQTLQFRESLDVTKSSPSEVILALPMQLDLYLNYCGYDNSIHRFSLLLFVLVLVCHGPSRILA